MTDKIRLTCPNCQKKLAVKASLAGKRVRCPDTACATLIKVPVPVEDIDEAPSAPPKARLLWLGLGGGGLALLLAVGVGMWAMTGRTDSPSPGLDGAGDAGNKSSSKTAAASPTANNTSATTPETGAAKPAAKLPGAAGPAQVELAKPPAGIAVKEINLLGEFSLRPKDQKLPSGTEQFSVEIAFPFLPNGTQIGVEVHSEQGLVPAPPRSLVRTRRSATEVRVSLECQTRDGAPFADGPYQAKVLINGQAVAALNFSVEGTPVADVDAAPLLTGTKWESKYGDGSGYRLEFGDKGTFEVHGLVSSGGHKPQWDKKTGHWSAKGDTFAAHADPAGEPRLRTEFRGKYVKKLNELLIKVRHQSKGDDGTIRFGGWYELAAGKKVQAFSTGQPLGKSPITEEKPGQLKFMIGGNTYRIPDTRIERVGSSVPKLPKDGPKDPS